MKIIITGTTGMVGEGVLTECLHNDMVSEILSVSRKSCEIKNPKLKELIIDDFLKLDNFKTLLTGYDACFYCAGISSVGMKEDKYRKITFDTTIHFAKTLLDVNPNMTFNFVSGKSTDSSEIGKIMWARIKGKTENALMKLHFDAQYNFRPGFMKHFEKQKNVKPLSKFFGLFYPTLFPKSSLTLQEVGRAMINVTDKGYSKQILEIEDIKQIARKSPIANRGLAL